VKPFLLLATRPEDEAADDEYEGFLSAGGLTPDELHRVRLEAALLPPIRLDDYSGIIVGGSPFNAGDPEATKSAIQVRVEAELQSLLDVVVARDFPFLGACYGIGLLTAHGGGVVDGTWPEDAGPTRVSLTEDGAADPLFGVLEPDFEAFVGHKEACTVLPHGAVLLAAGAAVPQTVGPRTTGLRVGARPHSGGSCGGGSRPARQFPPSSSRPGPPNSTTALAFGDTAGADLATQVGDSRGQAVHAAPTATVIRLAPQSRGGGGRREGAAALLPGAPRVW